MPGSLPRNWPSASSRAARQRPDDQLSGEQPEVAKFLAADAAFAAAAAAVQVHGGFGYATEYHVKRCWREARLMPIAPVPEEMVLSYLAEHLPGRRRSY